MQSLITNQVNIRNYYSHFSKEQEREADTFAAKKLNELNISTEYLIEFLELLEKKSFEKGFNRDDFKFSTHPIYKERYKILKDNELNINKSKKYNLNKKFFFVKSKLFGFTSQNSNEFYNYFYLY